MADYGGLFGVLTKKNAMGDDLPFSRTPQEETQKLSCYSIRYPPELDSNVLVQVERVDDTGIWGSMVDWGEECTAYLPIGSIGKEKGRGERKAQMHFLTRARRSKQQKNPMTFVASVQAVEQLSRNGVAVKGLDIEQEQFHVVVTRRGATNESEKKALDLSRKVQYCAFLVDKAASRARFSRLAARKMTLYASYERALAAACSDDNDDSDDCNDDEEEFIPEDAPAKFLFETIGSLAKDQVSSVLGLLVGENDRADDDRILPFASSLLDICRRENERRSQPVDVELTIAIGGSKAALKALDSGNVKNANTLLDQRHLLQAVSSAKNVPVPSGCDTGTIYFKGNGKYKLTTQAPPKLKEIARGYLENLGKVIQKTWESSATKGIPAGDEKQLPQSETSRSNGQMEPSVQPTINIGVIGDVANGKSTLVKALSGKKTQAHSSEQQQHGITIRLGFANAGVLQCQTCHSYSFLPESDGNEEHLPLCPKCESATKVVRRFSLIDCPGHAELMATMLAGASAFDAVLLAAAANVPCPTPQAKQHLQAINLSGILKKSGGRACVAIAQTKAELVADPSKNSFSLFTPEERLAHHAEEGRGKLVGSVACEAPIVPVCAPLGIGLEAIAEWIAHIPNASSNTAKHEPGQSETTRLQVLRSFDVNRPGLAADHLHGGVLGGTILGGGEISLGDELEVRPGLCSPPSKKKPSKEQQQTSPFNVHPLRFHCTSLMTAKTHLASATRGGLVAVGTSLDPSVCSDNRLVGSVAGAPGSLPPVWGPALLLDRLEFVDALAGPSNANMMEGSKSPLIKPSDLLKRGCEIRCHVGSATIKGVVAKISKSAKKLEIHLDGPVCASVGANVALEGKDSNTRSHVLVAHAKLFGGDLCQEGCNPTEVSQATTNSSSYDGGDDDDDFSSARASFETKHRQQFLEDLESTQAAARGVGGTARLSIPSPDISRDGGAHVLLSNFGLIAHALRREPEHMVLYLEKEGGIKSVLAGNRSSPATLTLRVHWRGGRGFSERFSSILKKYILAYVTCNQCRGAVTELLHGKAELCCRRCNARRFVAKL